MTKDALRKGRILGACQDGSREFISLIACICANGEALPPALIYKGESFDLQSSWLQDLQDSDSVYFAASKNGWSCDHLGIDWLKKVFDRHTRKGNRRRLLLVDGHSSHVNMKFIDLADQLRILILILPPHSTHRLQPLNVGLFSPLATAYSNELESLMHKSLGLVSMSKRMFYNIFKAAWEHSFTNENIVSTFKTTGVWPLDSSLVLDTIKKKEEVILSNNPTTPMTSKSIRRAQKDYQIEPTKQKLELLFKAARQLAAQHSVDEHEKRGLRKALQLEKKKRQRGKKLNLLGKEDVGPQFFSPSRVQAARIYQAKKEVEDQQRKDDIAFKKSQAKAKHLQREANKVAKVLQRAIENQVTQEEKAKARAKKEKARPEIEIAKAKAKAKKDTQKYTKSQTQDNANTQAMARLITQRRKRANTTVHEDVATKRVKMTTTRGRAVKSPQRLNY